MSRLPLAVRCPKGCKDYKSYGHDVIHYLLPIFGQTSEMKEPEIMALKCPKCGFDAYAGEKWRDMFGTDEDPYWDGERIIIPEKEERALPGNCLPGRKRHYFGQRTSMGWAGGMGEPRKSHCLWCGKKDPNWEKRMRGEMI